MFEFVEEAFDQISLTIETEVDGSLLLASSEGGDVRLGSVLGDKIDDSLGVVSPIGNGVGRGFQPGQQVGHSRLVGGLAGGHDQAHRQAMSIGDEMQLGAQSSTRTADGVIRAPFFPPAACWWARMIEESMR